MLQRTLTKPIAIFRIYFLFMNSVPVFPNMLQNRGLIFCVHPTVSNRTPDVTLITYLIFMHLFHIRRTIDGACRRWLFYRSACMNMVWVEFTAEAVEITAEIYYDFIYVQHTNLPSFEHNQMRKTAKHTWMIWLCQWSGLIAVDGGLEKVP